MGKVMKPPPTPMMAAMIPTITPPQAIITPDIFLPPGMKSSSKVIMGGMLRPWSLMATPGVPPLGLVVQALVDGATDKGSAGRTHQECYRQLDRDIAQLLVHRCAHDGFGK